LTGGVARKIALGACAVLHLLAPVSLRPWITALNREVESIENDRDALGFIAASFGLLVCEIIRARLANQSVHELDAGTAAVKDDRPTWSARGLAMVVAVTSVALGLAYMASAGAPPRLLAVNLGALVIGLAVVTLSRRSAMTRWPWQAAMSLAMALAVLGTAMFGISVEGAARWTQIAGLSLQPSLIVVPLMIMVFVRNRGKSVTLALCIAAIALALQPDRAMAGVLFAGVFVAAMVRPDPPAFVGCVASGLAFAMTLARPDTLPASPFVDQVYFTAFDVHLLAGLAVIAGTALLIAPALVGFLLDPANRAHYLVFAAIWLAAIASAAVGNYPTPVVGYSGGAVLGYVLSLGALPTARSQIRPDNALAPVRSSPTDRGSTLDRSDQIGFNRPVPVRQ
jgi:hypothetical protein